MNKEQFLPYDIALAFKKLGFNEKCLGYFNQSGKLICGINVPDESFLFTNIGKRPTACLAPLWQQAINWFEFEHGITISIKREYDSTFRYTLYCMKQNLCKKCNIEFYNSTQARLYGVLEAIKIVQNEY